VDNSQLSGFKRPVDAMSLSDGSSRAKLAATHASAAHMAVGMDPSLSASMAMLHGTMGRGGMGGGCVGNNGGVADTSSLYGMGGMRMGSGVVSGVGGDLSAGAYGRERQAYMGDRLPRVEQGDGYSMQQHYSGVQGLSDPYEIESTLVSDNGPQRSAYLAAHEGAESSK